VDTEELEALEPLHYSLVDVNGGMLGTGLAHGRRPVSLIVIRDPTIPGFIMIRVDLQLLSQRN
jgi:hypothetical protein